MSRRRRAVGCGLGLLLAAGFGHWLYKNCPADPRDPLPPGRAPGVLVFSPEGDRPFGRGLWEVIALDLSTLRAKRVPSPSNGVWAIAPDGRWVLAGTASAGISRMLLVERKGIRDVELPEGYGPIRLCQGAVHRDGWAVYETYDTACRIVRASLLDGSASDWHITPPMMRVTFGATAREFYGEDAFGRIYGFTLDQTRAMEIGRGWWPTVSLKGDLAWIASDRRAIIVQSRSGTIRHLAAPNRELVYGVVWSPDGGWLAYKYARGPFRWHTRFTESYALGIMGAATGQAYRVFPIMCGATKLQGSLGGNVLWVEEIDPAVLDHLQALEEGEKVADH